MLNGGNMEELIKKIATKNVMYRYNHNFLIILYSLINLKILGDFIMVNLIQLTILVKFRFNYFFFMIF